MGKGYKLTSATGDGPKQCAFFFSDKGCRNGANCKFSHEAVTNQKHSSPSSPPSVSSSSAVSSESESEGEIVENRAGAYASLAKLADKAKQHIAANSSGATGRPNDVAVSNAAVAAAPTGFSSNNPFLAVPPATPNAAHAATSTTPAKAAEAAVATPQPQQQQQQQSEKKKKKRKKSLTPGENVFDIGSPSNPPGNATTTVADLKSLVAPPPPKTAAKEPIATPIPPPAKKSKTNNNKSTPTPGVPSFRDLQLPTTSFSLPTPAAATTATPSPAPPTSRPPTPQHEPAHLPPPPPLPTATPQHRLWTKAVVSTRSHPNYSNSYTFPPSATPGWISPRPHGPWCASAAIPAAIAIDCEMCETRDPLTQTLNPKALCRLSIVNADRPSEILIDTLVKPEWPVSNHRTWVNGIGSSDLEHVQFTLQHAQQFMMALCSDQTVIVGHAVHNDLMALRMIHHCVVDTAMLFAHAGEEEGSTPSLKNVAYGALKGREMPEVHDSVNDARVALECALFWRERDGVVDPVEKVFSRNAGSRGYKSVDPNETATLLVHRLPRTTEAAHIEEMFLAFTFVKPKLVKEIAFSGTHGKCYVEFASADHANLAYDTLLGEEREDKTGKKQKRVGLKGGGYVCVRKMRKGK